MERRRFTADFTREAALVATRRQAARCAEERTRAHASRKDTPRRNSRSWRSRIARSRRSSRKNTIPWTGRRMIISTRAQSSVRWTSHCSIAARSDTASFTTTAAAVTAHLCNSGGSEHPSKHQPTGAPCRSAMAEICFATLKLELTDGSPSTAAKPTPCRARVHRTVLQPRPHPVGVGLPAADQAKRKHRPAKSAPWLPGCRMRGTPHITLH
jgi:hypothetical protein